MKKKEKLKQIESIKVNSIVENEFNFKKGPVNLLMDTGMLKGISNPNIENPGPSGRSMYCAGIYCVECHTYFDDYWKCFVTKCRHFTLTKIETHKASNYD
jgi:hypothetical protein